MKVLVVGSGGREHALAWKAARGAGVERVFVAPGNPGTALEKNVENVPVSAADHDALAAFARESGVDLTIVGPEAPLSAGLVDRFEADGLRCFGPARAAAALEASKNFAKEFMQRHGIPTARHASFTDVGAAENWIRREGAPIVVKADGLAAGKGVVVAREVEEAIAAVRDMLGAGRFGEAGRRVVIEEFLEGEEASFMVMSDGEHVLPLASSQDHKPRDDGDRGPNTGGMGAYSPAPVVTPAVHEAVMERIIRPAVRGMREEGTPYRGFLYAGLMIGKGGEPRVVEFNCRLGDPETQPILMRLEGDLVALCLAALEGRLDACSAEWDPRPALGVVLAAAGYPGDVRKGDVITGLDTAERDNVKVFHAGTAMRDGELVTAGGRVLCVTALGDDIAAARQAAYDVVSQIHWNGMFCRSDIGHRALARETCLQS